MKCIYCLKRVLKLLWRPKRPPTYIETITELTSIGVAWERHHTHKIMPIIRLIAICPKRDLIRFGKTASQCFEIATAFTCLHWEHFDDLISGRLLPNVRSQRSLEDTESFCPKEALLACMYYSDPLGNSPYKW